MLSLNGNSLKVGEQWLYPGIKKAQNLTPQIDEEILKSLAKAPQ
jgi:hypothetical protein